MMLKFKNQIIFGFLCCLGIAILILGFFQLNKNIKSPFIRKGYNQGSVSDKEAENLLALQKKDTDKDGLSDFDELHLYKTSPYLSDTDSDGFLDKQEVDSGNDPNCPSGKICFKALSDININTNISQVPSQGAVNLNAANPFTQNIDQLVNGPVTTDSLRKVLLEAGIPADVLKKIDDKSLMDLYQETLKETKK